ncbi:hypothetical protein AJ80_06416 [Polytolypa hystricis UAMH7299]|uniref:Fucose-specific lectin n=1 Tax=Polytolypa hystricis (strain UAMH7299) TaxID=1447883 RepID=A0A2B7XVY5_POLH7|nr:hypothetical protein AJ80_06416 [Polytolypa hystricis UAMH7299]
MYDAEKNGLSSRLTLFSGDTDGHVHEYIYNDEDESWSDGFTFPSSNGYGGASAWSQDSCLTTMYLFMLSESQMIYFWHYDYNETEEKKDTENGPWHLGPTNHTAVMANASMCADGRIQETNSTTVVDVDSMRWHTTYDISDNAVMENSALSCWYLFPSEHEEDEKRMMFQVFIKRRVVGL